MLALIDNSIRKITLERLEMFRSRILIKFWGIPLYMFLSGQGSNITFVDEKCFIAFSGNLIGRLHGGEYFWAYTQFSLFLVVVFSFNVMPAGSSVLLVLKKWPTQIHYVSSASGHYICYNLHHHHHHLCPIAGAINIITTHFRILPRK